MTSEQRHDVRKRTFLKGRILFNKGAASMDCLIRDLSEAGARLELSETSTLPEVFDLYIAQKEETFRATLRWRRDNSVGIAFADQRKPVAPPEAAAPCPTPPSTSCCAGSPSWNPRTRPSARSSGRWAHPRPGEIRPPARPDVFRRGSATAGFPACKRSEEASPGGAPG